MWLIFGFLVVLTISVFLAYSISEYFKETILQRATFIQSNLIKSHATLYDLNKDSFNSMNIADNQKLFSEFTNSIDTPEIVSIKMWNVNHMITYSDDPDLIGKSFYDNKKLDTALMGQIVSGISYLEDSDNISERGNTELMEIYVPLKTNSGQIYGVVEIYLAMDLINVYIDNTNWMIFVITSFSAAAFGIIIFMTFMAFRKNVINPIVNIHEQTKKIKNGNLDIKCQSKGYNELKVLGQEVESMAQKIKDQQNKIIKTERIYAIGELAARLAHDLRNPLNVIRNSLAIIRHKYKTNPEAESSFDRIDRSVFRMTHQIDNVMDFVHTKSLRLEMVSIRRILISTLEKLDFTDKIDVKITQNDIVTMVDINAIEVVFENLLVNAKQAIKEKGSINIEITRENNFVKISVEDTGQGIPDEVLPKIFDPLFTTKQEGTGLGLPSCKNIVEQHGGTIEVKTQIGKGTTFTVKLPITKFETQSLPPNQIDENSPEFTIRNQTA